MNDQNTTETYYTTEDDKIKRRKERDARREQSFEYEGAENDDDRGL
jgi:hypothetical protein